MKHDGVRSGGGLVCAATSGPWPRRSPAGLACEGVPAGQPHGASYQWFRSPFHMPEEPPVLPCAGVPRVAAARRPGRIWEPEGDPRRSRELRQTARWCEHGPVVRVAEHEPYPAAGDSVPREQARQPTECAEVDP
jgi:hypothetical protein